MKRINVGTVREAKSAVAYLNCYGALAFDVETTGLDPITDKMFACCIHNGTNSYYFTDKTIMEWVIKSLFFAHPLHLSDVAKRRLLVAHNAVFDISFAAALVGIEYRLSRAIWCTKEMHRLICSSTMKRSLDALAKLYNIGEKSKEVEDYIREHGLHDGTKHGRLKNPRFKDVPEEIMFKYCCIDTELCFKLFKEQYKKIRGMCEEAS